VRKNNVKDWTLINPKKNAKNNVED